MEQQKCRICGKRHPLGPCPVEHTDAARGALDRRRAEGGGASTVRPEGSAAPRPEAVVSSRALSMRVLRAARYSDAELAAEIARLRERLELLEGERRLRARG